ncbi:MAG: hypothetical protein KDJ12_11215, partial [Hyphomicrobiales bacterium]|nr:hypothetical protein [Hyphomicrobiales bacterium]
LATRQNSACGRWAESIRAPIRPTALARKLRSEKRRPARAETTSSAVQADGRHYRTTPDTQHGLGTLPGMSDFSQHRAERPW